jgi:hypothetical protein
MILGDGVAWRYLLLALPASMIVPLVPMPSGSTPSCAAADRLRHLVLLGLWVWRRGGPRFLFWDRSCLSEPADISQA